MPTKRNRGDRWEFTIKRAKLLKKPIYLTFDTEAEGDDYCRRLERQLDAGIIPPELAEGAASPKNFTSVAQAIRRYQANMPLAKTEITTLDTVSKKIGTHQIGEVNRLDWIDNWLAHMKRVEVLKPASVRTYVGSMARMFDYLVRIKAIEANAFRLLPKRYALHTDADKAALRSRGLEPATDSVRDRRLHEGELEKIIEVLEGRVPDGRRMGSTLAHRESMIMLVELAVESAMRMREMYTLSFEQIDLGKRTVFLDKTKNGDSRQVPLSSVALAKLTTYLAKVKEAPFENRMPFPWWNGSLEPRQLQAVSNLLSNRFRRLFDIAGCKDLRFHDLRHEAVCRLFEKTKMPHLMISRVTGHRDPSQLLRYLSLRGSDLAEYMW